MRSPPLPCRARLLPSWLAVLMALTASAPWWAPRPAHAGPEDDLREAQQRANRAASDLAGAEDELARSEDELSRVQDRVAAVEARVAAAREQVRHLAVRLYVEGTSPITRVLRMADANQVVRAQQFSHVIAGTSIDSIGAFRAEREDLGLELEALAQEQRARAAALDGLREREATAVAEIDRLARAVEAARAAEQARLVAQQRAAPAGPADGPAPQAPGTNGLPSGPAERAPAAAPAAPAQVEASGEWICPVQGPRAFSDDYGAPRGGGFRHQGNDILAPRGTPVVANVDGVVRHRSGNISGLAYYLDGDDGNEYFGAHLDSYGASGRVTAGTVVGTVGDTGDAKGGPPHLHFEVHPGGSGNINPYSLLSRYC